MSIAPKFPNEPLPSFPTAISKTEQDRAWCTKDKVALHVERLDQTLALIKLGHKGQLYNLRPYWHHPVRVMLRIWRPAILAPEVEATLMHDLIEDSQGCIGLNDLRHFGYRDQTIEILGLLTRDEEEETYQEYIDRLVRSKNVFALRIKLADLFENLNNLRFIPGNKKGRAERYGKAITAVSEVLLSDNSIAGEWFRDKVDFGILSGELNADEVRHWIGEDPRFT